LSTSISVLKNDLKFPNINSVSCCKALHSLCYFLLITISNGLTFIYSMPNELSDLEDLYEFLIDKKNKFILYDTNPESPLKNISINMNVKVNLHDLLLNIKSNNLFNSEIYKQLSEPKDFLLTLFKMSPEVLGGYFSNDYLMYITCLSCSIFDTYCLIEQDIIQCQTVLIANQIQNLFPKSFIWTESRNCDKSTQTESVLLEAPRQKKPFLYVLRCEQSGVSEQPQIQWQVIPQQPIVQIPIQRPPIQVPNQQYQHHPRFYRQQPQQFGFRQQQQWNIGGGWQQQRFHPPPFYVAPFQRPQQSI